MNRPSNLNNYFTKVMDKLAERLPDCADNPVLLAAYAQLVLTAGSKTTLENVHDAWSAWRVNSDRPGHPDIVWFDELAPEVQEYDNMYREGIIAVAKEMGR